MKTLLFVWIPMALIFSLVVLWFLWNWAYGYAHTVKEFDASGYPLAVQIALDDISYVPQQSQSRGPESGETEKSYADLAVTTTAGDIPETCRSVTVPRCDRNTQSAIISLLDESGCIAQVECVPIVTPNITCDYTDPVYNTKVTCGEGQVGITVVGRDGCFLPNMCIKGKYE